MAGVCRISVFVQAMLVHLFECSYVAGTLLHSAVALLLLLRQFLLCLLLVVLVCTGDLVDARRLLSLYSCPAVAFRCFIVVMVPIATA